MPEAAGSAQAGRRLRKPDSDDASGPVVDAAVVQREVLRRLRPFAITYALVSLPRLLRIVGQKGSAAKRLELILWALLRPTRTTVKLSLFPAVLPFTYQTLFSLLQRLSPTHFKFTRGLAILLSSPAIFLLPHGLRVYLAMYTITSALTTFLKSASPHQQARKILEGRAGEPEWRDYLPPVTILNAIGNSYMVWTWFHDKGIFPKSYEKLILEHAPHYVPPSRPPLEIRDFLETTINPLNPSSSPSPHQYLVCATLHPDEPSCLKNHALAWLHGVPQTLKWVAGFGAAETFLSFKKRIMSEPVEAIRAWVDYTIRGSLYVTGSVQTVWGAICLLQRILPGTFMPKSRWIINGTLASLWVYALNSRRQSQISIYVARLGLLSLWRAYKKRAYPSLPYGELLIFALGWEALKELQDGGWRIEGLMRRAVAYVEGREGVLKREATAGWTPPGSGGVSRVPSADSVRVAFEEGEIGLEGTSSSRSAANGNGAGGVDAERVRREAHAMRISSLASTMSAVSDSGFGTDEDDDEHEEAEIKVESRIRNVSQQGLYRES